MSFYCTYKTYEKNTVSSSCGGSTGCGFMDYISLGDQYRHFLALSLETLACLFRCFNMQCSLSCSVIFTYAILLPWWFESISILLSFPWLVSMFHEVKLRCLILLGAFAGFPKSGLHSLPMWFLCSFQQCVIVAHSPWHMKFCENPSCGIFHFLLFPRYLA